MNYMVEVLRRHSKDLGAVQRVKRLQQHLEQTPNRVSSHSKPRLRYQPFKLSQRFDARTVVAIVAAYQAGTTAKELAERYGVARSSITRLLHHRDVRVRRQSPTDADVQRIMQLYANGLSGAAIANQLGWSNSTVSRLLARIRNETL